MPKESVLDPQGEAVLNALQELHYSEAQEVRIGKYIQLWLNVEDPQEANEKAKQICEKLLVNEVIETYHFDIIKVSEKSK